MTLTEKARAFAERAHRGQVRKYTGEPYITHPAEVAAIVATIPHCEAQIAAAWLHDVIEDTPATVEDIEREFGPEVAGLVGWLTDVSKPEDGNRAVRKAMDLAHLATAPPEAQTVKYADIISNTRSIVEHDPKFAKVYIAEKRALLNAMTEGDAILRNRALITR